MRNSIDKMVTKLKDVFIKDKWTSDDLKSYISKVDDMIKIMSKVKNDCKHEPGYPYMNNHVLHSKCKACGEELVYSETKGMSDDN